MKKIINILLAVSAVVCTSVSLYAQSAKKTVAVFVRNDSNNYKEFLDVNKKNMENILSSYINNSGFGVISHDLVLRNLNDYIGNENAKYTDVAKKVKKQISENEKLDVKLFENASGLRLAEMIGADYILSVSISSLSEVRKTSTLYGVKTQNTIYTLHCNYNLFEGGMGIGTSGKSVKSSKMIRQTSGMVVEKDEEFFNELLEDCAVQMSQVLENSLASNKIIAKVDAKSEVVFEVKVREMRFPQIYQLEDGSYGISQSSVPLELMIINAEIDGVSYTTNTGAIKLSRGIHYLKIYHKDFEPIERTINVTGEAGQKFSYEAILNDSARRRLQADMEWMQNTVDSYKASIYNDEMNKIDVRKANVEIAQMKSDIENEKKLVDAEVRQMDSENSERIILAKGEATLYGGEAKYLVNISKAEIERTRQVYNSLESSGYKVYANVPAQPVQVNANVNANVVNNPAEKKPIEKVIIKAPKKVESKKIEDKKPELKKVKTPKKIEAKKVESTKVVVKPVKKTEAKNNTKVKEKTNTETKVDKK